MPDVPSFEDRPYDAYDRSDGTVGVTHPADRRTVACPACDATRVLYHGDGDPPFRCRSCGAGFDDPLVRSTYQEADPGSAVKTLARLHPDDVTP